MSRQWLTAQIRWSKGSQYCWQPDSTWIIIPIPSPFSLASQVFIRVYSEAQLKALLAVLTTRVAKDRKGASADDAVSHDEHDDHHGLDDDNDHHHEGGVDKDHHHHGGDDLQRQLLRRSHWQHQLPTVTTDNSSSSSPLDCHIHVRLVGQDDDAYKRTCP